MPDTFYNFNSWTELLQAQELVKANPPATPGAPVDPAEANLRRANYILSESDFKAIGDKVFENEVKKVGQDLLRERQKHGLALKGSYVGLVWERWAKSTDPKKQHANQMLDALGQGQVVFNFIRDFDTGSYDWNDARVVSVKLTTLKVQTKSDDLKLTILIEQLGDMMMGRKNLRRPHLVCLSPWSG